MPLLCPVAMLIGEQFRHVINFLTFVVYYWCAEYIKGIHNDQHIFVLGFRPFTYSLTIKARGRRCRLS